MNPLLKNLIIGISLVTLIILVATNSFSQQVEGGLHSSYAHSELAETPQVYSIGAHFMWLEDQYDAYAGWVGNCDLYPDSLVVLVGWQLATRSDFCMYIGNTIGASFGNDILFAWEVYAGAKYYFDYGITPFIEGSVGGAYVRTGVSITIQTY